MSFLMGFVSFSGSEEPPVDDGIMRHFRIVMSGNPVAGVYRSRGSAVLNETASAYITAGGVASASSGVNPDRAWEGGAAGGWESVGVGEQYIQMELPEPYEEEVLYWTFGIPGTIDAAPTHLTLLGSSNGTTWTMIDDRDIAWASNQNGGLRILVVGGGEL